jgi:alpha-L-fucosidase 2
MNYWPAETCNLSDCAQPLIDFIVDLRHTGTLTASETYGLPGWCAHHNIDLWRAEARDVSGAWVGSHLEGAENLGCRRGLVAESEDE